MGDSKDDYGGCLESLKKLNLVLKVSNEIKFDFIGHRVVLPRKRWLAVGNGCLLYSEDCVSGWARVSLHFDKQLLSKQCFVETNHWVLSENKEIWRNPADLSGLKRQDVITPWTERSTVPSVWWQDRKQMPTLCPSTSIRYPKALWAHQVFFFR